MSERMIYLLINGTIDTITMTFVSGFLGFVLGLPLGVLLYITRKDQVMENVGLYRALAVVVNIFRSVPFIILLVWIIPLTSFLVGTTIGLKAAPRSEPTEREMGPSEWRSKRSALLLMKCRGLL